MNLNDDQIKKIEECAACFLSYKEIAIILDQPVNDFISEIKNPITLAYAAYERGKVNSKFKLRKRVIQMAEYGSQSAGQLAEQYMTEQTKKERDVGT